MIHPNKIMEAVILLAAVLTFLLLLALVISSDAYSTATQVQVQVHGDLALVQLNLEPTDGAHGAITPAATQVVTQ
jgi:homogentisate 1,2-dioxygenase